MGAMLSMPAWTEHRGHGPLLHGNTGEAENGGHPCPPPCGSVVVCSRSQTGNIKTFPVGAPHGRDAFRSGGDIASRAWPAPTWQHWRGGKRQTSLSAALRVCRCPQSFAGREDQGIPCRSAPWARCFPCRRGQSIAGMARSCMATPARRKTADILVRRPAGVAASLAHRDPEDQKRTAA